MSYVVMSDVHSNLEALTAVTDVMEKRALTDIFFLGDAVGYGPDPNECVDILAKTCSVLLTGNHDWGVCGLTDVSCFNVYARAAIEWTRTVISKKHENILRSLPLIATPHVESVTLVHSSPFEPGKWHYIMSLADAEVNFHFFETAICFIGHSHRPFIMEQIPSGTIRIHTKKVVRDSECRYIVNVGSVGQPRDGNAQASYAIVTEDSIRIERVSYNFTATQAKMKRAGLPEALIERLSVGF